MWLSLALLLGGLALVSVSGIVLTGQIERASVRLHFSAGLLGIVAALGADAPEISSAISALASGNRDVGLGVVLGSNVYNIAALLGLSAVVARRGVRVGREGLWLNGGVALAVTVVTALLVLHLIAGALALALSLFILGPYVIVSSFGAAKIERAGLPAPLARFLCNAVVNVERDTRRAAPSKRGSSLDALSMVPALACIVFGSMKMVDAAVDLGKRWNVPQATTGILVLAVLTGIPNTIAALRLARHGRGAAVLSEALNSNSINIVFGVCAPVLVMGREKESRNSLLSLAFLSGMTIVALIFASRRSGLQRLQGVLLLVLYAGFVGLVLV